MQNRLKTLSIAALLVAVGALMPLIAQTEPTGTLRGHVFDSEGAAIARAKVYVRVRMPDQDAIRLMTRTDLKGDFQLVVLAGAYDVLVTSEGFAAKVESVGIVAGKTTKTQWKMAVLGCDFPGVNCDTVD